MYSIPLLLLATANAGVALWGLREWDRLRRSTILLFCLLALAAVTAHVLLAGLGRFVGAGEELRGLYALPLIVATLALPATLFTFATISRGTGFAWARIDWGHGAVCLFAVALMLYSLPGILTMPKFPIVAAAVLAAWLGLGAGLWWRQRWPWLLAGMGAGVTLLLLPADGGPVPQLLGESLCFCAMVAATVRYLRQVPAPAEAVAAGDPPA